MPNTLPVVFGTFGEYLVKNELNKPSYLELNPCMSS